MTFDELKDKARLVADLQKTEVQTKLRDCEVIYGLDATRRCVVQFGRKAIEGAVKPSGAKSMVFLYHPDKGEYEVLRAAATAAMGEHVVMKEG